MFRNLISKSLLIVKRTTINKQLLFRNISSVKSSDLKNSSNPSNEKISGDYKDIEAIEKLMLNKGIYSIYICIPFFFIIIIYIYNYIIILLLF